MNGAARAPYVSDADDLLAELDRLCGEKARPVPSVGRDQEVVGANELVATLEIGANARVMTCRDVLEFQRFDVEQKGFERRTILLWTCNNSTPHNDSAFVIRVRVLWLPHPFRLDCSRSIP